MIESVFLLSLLLHPCAHLSNHAFYQIAFSILPLNSSLSFLFVEKLIYLKKKKQFFIIFFSIIHDILHHYKLANIQLDVHRIYVVD